MSPSRSSSDTCRSCRAPIMWVRTESGSNMPIDTAPVENGNVILSWDDDGRSVAVFIRKGETPPAGKPRYVSHFATCPKSRTHRGQPRRAPAPPQPEPPTSEPFEQRGLL